MVEQHYFDEALRLLGLAPNPRRVIRPPVGLAPPPASSTAAEAAPSAADAGVALEHVGEALRAAREEQGVSLGELEELTGMSRGRLSRIENLILRNPKLDTLIRIAEALNLRLRVTLEEAGS